MSRHLLSSAFFGVVIPCASCSRRKRNLLLPDFGNEDLFLYNHQKSALSLCSLSLCDHCRSLQDRWVMSDRPVYLWRTCGDHTSLSSLNAGFISIASGHDDRCRRMSKSFCLCDSRHICHGMSRCVASSVEAVGESSAMALLRTHISVANLKHLSSFGQKVYSFTLPAYSGTGSRIRIHAFRRDLMQNSLDIAFPYDMMSRKQKTTQIKELPNWQRTNGSRH